MRPEDGIKRVIAVKNIQSGTMELCGKSTQERCDGQLVNSKQSGTVRTTGRGFEGHGSNDMHVLEETGVESKWPKK